MKGSREKCDRKTMPIISPGPGPENYRKVRLSESQRHRVHCNQTLLKKCSAEVEVHWEGTL